MRFKFLIAFSFYCLFIYITRVDGQCTCKNGKHCNRIRKEFTSMTRTEQKRYLRAYKKLSADRKYKREYVKLIKLHQRLFDTRIHSASEFLPWHRWYLLEFENLLQKVDCSVTVPYWDWSLRSHNPWSSKSIWSSGSHGFGGNGRRGGGCVQSGIFSQRSRWKFGNRCLKRDFYGKTPDEIAVAEVLKIKRFRDFELALRANLHDDVHCLVGGTMCTSQSAEAPEFLLHHAFVDQIWDEWQSKSSSNKKAHFTRSRRKMHSLKYLPRHLIDLKRQPGGVSIHYAEPTANNAKAIKRKLKSKSSNALRRVPRLFFNKVPRRARRLFRLNTIESGQAHILENFMRGNVLSPSQKLKTVGEENDLGFKITSL